MSEEYVKGYAIRRNSTCETGENQCTKTRHGVTTRRVVPEILSAFLPTLEFPISYVATIKTNARKIY